MYATTEDESERGQSTTAEDGDDEDDAPRRWRGERRRVLVSRLEIWSGNLGWKGVVNLVKLICMMRGRGGRGR
jgi:hypothetical protein